MENLYVILGVQKNASESEIRSAFRLKAKKYHPDVNASKEAHLIFLKIHEAYEVLMDRQKRLAYNQKLDRENLESPYKKYESWVQEQKIKQAKAEKRKHEDFLKRKEAIRTSKMYYPYKLALHFGAIFLSGLCFLVLVACAFAIYNYHLFLFFFLMPFICGAAVSLKLTIDAYKEYKALLS